MNGAPLFGGCLERREVALVLIGVRGGEVGDRAIEANPAGGVSQSSTLALDDAGGVDRDAKTISRCASSLAAPWIVSTGTVS